MSVPPELISLFHNYDTGKMDLDKSKTLLILTALSKGTFEQIELIFKLYGFEEIKAVFLQDYHGLRTLPVPTICFWGHFFLESELLDRYKKECEDGRQKWTARRMVP